VIRHSGQVVAVVVPIEEYQQLRPAMQEQQVNEEFDATRASYLARRSCPARVYGIRRDGGDRPGWDERTRCPPLVACDVSRPETSPGRATIRLSSDQRRVDHGGVAPPRRDPRRRAEAAG
jgi:hypothetical protein